MAGWPLWICGIPNYILGAVISSSVTFINTCAFFCFLFQKPLIKGLTFGSYK